MTCNEIELEIQVKKLTKPETARETVEATPRITRETIEAEIVEICYWQPPKTTVTVCVLKFRSGYTVVGNSAGVPTDNFDAGLDEKIAYQNAIDKCWFAFHLATDLVTKA